MRRTSLLIVGCLLLPSLLAAVEGDQGKPSKTKSEVGNKTQTRQTRLPAKKLPAKSLPKITKDQEKAATAFVTQHHDELLELLIHLKEGLPQEYNRAVRDLSRTSERLATFAKRDNTRYELELKLWQVQSNRQLLQARLQMTKDDSLIGQIRGTLTKERDVKTAILKHERERLVARIEKLDEQIARQESGDDSSIERQLKTITRSPKKTERKVKSTNRKPNASKPVKKPT